MLLLFWWFSKDLIDGFRSAVEDFTGFVPGVV